MEVYCRVGWLNVGFDSFIVQRATTFRGACGLKNSPPGLSRVILCVALIIFLLWSSYEKNGQTQREREGVLGREKSAFVIPSAT